VDPADDVVADDHVDGAVDLDARALPAAEVAQGVGVLDQVPLDQAGHQAALTGDPRLAAAVDAVVADDVVAGLIGPAGPADVPLPLMRQTARLSLRSLFWMIQRSPQLVMTIPSWGLDGGAQLVAACWMWKPSRVMYSAW
jgi:hypothetical protein